MTDESNGREPQEHSHEAASAGDPAMPGKKDLGLGAGLVVLAGVLLLANYVLFELIFPEYFISPVLLLLAVAAVVLPWLQRDLVESFHPLGQLMKVIGYSIVIFGVFDIIGDIRFDFHPDLRSLVGAFAAYFGYVVALVGARSIKT